ncbi:hypothetical protein EDC94DRAFT_696998 [Helicostylum pulchrum]|nr:hypothetical protein EDC94DRAFT_696998 [Helicostylum pulchrum]
MAAEMKKEGVLLVNYLSLFMIKPISRYVETLMYSDWTFFALLGLLLFLYFLLCLKLFVLLGSLSGASNIFMVFGANWCGYILS